MITKKILLILTVIILIIVFISVSNAYFKSLYSSEVERYKIKYDVEVTCHSITKLRLREQITSNEETEDYLKLTFDELSKCRNLKSAGGFIWKYEQLNN